MNENQDKGTAISVYGQEGLDDFPVLRAFQQYIDAEQSKARKRMVMLCVFFGFLMTLVIGVFVMMLRDKDAKNQSLNDKLVEYVMREREREVSAKVEAQRPKEDPAIKAMAESIASLQRQMSDQQVRLADQQTKLTDQQNKLAEQQRAMAERQEKAATAAAAAAAQAEKAAKAVQEQGRGPSKEQLALQRQIDSDTAKLMKVRALLRAEKERLDAEKERLRKEEVERQRRKLYPEFYEKDGQSAKKDEKKDEKKDVKKDEKPAAKDEPPKDDRGPISYFSAYKDKEDDESDLDDLDELIAPAIKERKKAENGTRPNPPPAAKPKSNAERPAAKPASKPAAKPEPKPAVKPETKPAAKPEPKPIAKPEPKSEEAPSDHLKVPVEINGADSDWLIPTA